MLSDEQKLTMEISDDMLDVIDHLDDFTRGDLQAVVEAIINNAILMGEKLERSKNEDENNNRD